MATKSYKANITFDNKKLTFEGPKEFVEEMVARYTASSKLQGKGPRRGSAIEAIGRESSGERELIAEKQPKGHHEIVVVLAFGLTEAGTRQFTEEDIRRAYIRAGVRPPKVVAQALRDAKNKYDYLELAGGRGKYRLTHHGDRVVRFDLPRGGAHV